MANWGASKKRALMRRRGTEGSRDDSASLIRRPVRDKPKTPRVSKGQLRADAAVAFIAWRDKAKQVPPCS
jgi:hypothetical protein